jgi:hypothetical protein
MNRGMLLGLAASCLVATPLLAEQQVTLKSGAMLVGDVSFDGDAIVVKIDGAASRFALDSVASVAPLAFDQGQQARRLLLNALEIRLGGGGPKEAVGLLAEAARLSPDDPQIAFWYASTLVDAGSGRAASRTFEEHREAIEAAFPDRVAKLAERIKFRMMVEMLPPDLLARIDGLNEAAAVQPLNATVRPMAVVFRVLDQYKDPVEQAAVEIGASANDERLEQFADGYYLFTFVRNRGDSDAPCRLAINFYGLQRADYEFRAGAERVAVAGEYVVHRYVEVDKRPLRVSAADHSGAHLAGVLVELRPSSRVPEGANLKLTATTDDDGKAEFVVFPGNYGYSASKVGFNGDAGNVEVNADESQDSAQQLVLYRSIPGKFRVAWRTTPIYPGAEPSSGDVTIDAGGSGPLGNPGFQGLSSWLRPVQNQEELTLQVTIMQYGPPIGLGRGAPWIKKYEVDDSASPDERVGLAKDAFEAVDLKNVDDLGNDYEKVEGSNIGMPYNNSTFRLPVKLGAVYVGSITGRDARTGQPCQLDFKVLVEQVGDAPAPP